ncbi:MAG: hypothetical protein B7Z74_08335 [Deltaproteobacteria bacterium 21-66-5]|nr:MAG: hypothetical protein B7Z74_08335 [Deltaproteobacteria bacterium 21-66-5]HQU45744.1 hypothetical protein [Pirellulales bacterium]
MPDVRVTRTLPYLLLLPDREYATPAVGGAILVREITGTGSSTGTEEPQTELSAVFASASNIGKEMIKQIRVTEADRLLRRANHLLRWYRAVSRQPYVIELSRAQASPFLFTAETTAIEWSEPLKYDATPEPSPANTDDIQEAILAGLSSAAEPSVASLSMLDAEYAIKTGRFREAILFCWSAIDATFGRKYEALVDDALAEEWADARRFFRGHADIPLRHRMSAAMHLVANRSFYREPGLWDDLSRSYDHRNAIIHNGASASEADAELAFSVAKRVVAIMESC